jgi:RNase P/RNase MRP subunit p30
MYDIIRCEADAGKHGFTRLYPVASCKGKVLELDNLAAAAEYKNRKSLILLKDWAFDEGAIRVIAEKESACFLIDLGRLMGARGVQRSIAISKLRNFLAICVKYNAFYTFATFAGSENEIRSPQEMESMACLLGINRGQAKFALKMLGHYL